MFQILYVVSRTLYSWKRILSVAAILTIAFYGLINPIFALSPADSNWKDLQERGTAALDANEYWIAEPLLKKAMGQAEKFQPRDMRLVKSLGELARLYTIRGWFDEAEPFWEEQLNIQEQILGEDRGKCIPTMGALIQFYLQYGTKSKAYPLTEELLFLVEGKLDEARAGSVKTKLKKGTPLQGWLGIAAPVMKDPAIEWAITCDAVGNCHRTLGSFKLADRLFRAALDLKTTVLGKDHLSLANSYDSLGALYLEKKNDPAEAESYYADALDITEKILPQESHEIFPRLDQLAKCLIKEGKYQQAEELYQRALGFWNKQPAIGSDQARALYALGSLYVQEHKYDAAAPILQQALRLAEKANGPDSIVVVPYLQKYAYTLYYLGRKPEMEQLQVRANTISGVNM